MEPASTPSTKRSGFSRLDRALALVPGTKLTAPKRLLIFPLLSATGKPLKETALEMLAIGEEILGDLQEFHDRKKEFNRGELVERIQNVAARLAEISPKFQQTYSVKALTKTMAKLEEYIATRPAPYCAAWANDFGCKIQALSILIAYEHDDRLAELGSHPFLYKSLMYNAYGADALRACKISDRDKILFDLREAVNLVRPLKTIQALRDVAIELVRKVGVQEGFQDLPSTRCAESVCEFLSTEQSLSAARNVLSKFTGLLQAENRILREVIPSELWGTKTQPTPDLMTLCHDNELAETERHLRWITHGPTRPIVDAEELQQMRDDVIAASRHLIPQDSIQPVVEFHHLPQYLKNELVIIERQTRLLGNPDSMAKLHELERQGFVTHIIPINQTIMCAYQVQYSHNHLTANENAILNLAREARPHLGTKQPIYVRLIIKDARDQAESALLDERPYEQGLNATLDRVLCIGAEDPTSPHFVDPRRIFLFAEVLVGNPAMEAHQKRGWEDVGAEFTFTRDDGVIETYKVIIYDPETLKGEEQLKKSKG